jgi:hypothetical protein
MEKLETDKRLLQLKLEQPDQNINSNNNVRFYFKYNQLRRVRISLNRVISFCEYSMLIKF